MKWLAMLAAVQLVAGQAAAATLEPVEAGPVRAGAFAGARLTVTLGGAGHRQLRGGLGLGPLRTGQLADGRIVRHFGEGLQLGPTGRGGFALSAGGRQVIGPVHAREGEAERRKGVPGWALIAGGAVLLLGAAAVAYWQIGEAATE